MKKTWPEMWCLLTLSDVLLIIFGVLLNAFGCLLMCADARWRHPTNDCFSPSQPNLKSEMCNQKFPYEIRATSDERRTHPVSISNSSILSKCFNF